MGILALKVVVESEGVGQQDVVVQQRAVEVIVLAQVVVNSAEVVRAVPPADWAHQCC